MHEEVIGGQRLILGDCLEVLPTLAAGSVDAVVTDPPYGISGQPSKIERAKYGNPLRKMVYGEWDKQADVGAAFEAALLATKDTGTFYIFCGGEQLSDFLRWMQGNGFSTRTLAWVKRAPNIANGQHLWLAAVETIAFGRKSHAYFGVHCRAGVWWEQPPAGAARYHPTQKPDTIIADFIAASVPDGGTVLDPFMGSGTTLVAAEILGRRGIGIEIDEGYFDIACRRVEETVRKRERDAAQLTLEAAPAVG